MNAQDYWSIFLETGAPEAYLLYAKALKTEEKHVFEDTGVSSARHRLQ